MKRRGKMRKISLIVVSVMMIFVLAFSLVGCGNPDEKAIRDGLTQEFNQFKDPKSNLWQKEMKKELKGLSDLGINVDDMITAWVKDLSFKVGTIKIDGNKATAEVSITCRQFYPAFEAATNRLMEEDIESFANEAAVYKRYGELIVDELNKQKPVTTVINIPCKKDGNTWSDDKGAEEEYARALLGPEPKL